MNFSFIEIWPLLAGLGLFLFGMSVIEDSLNILIGRSMKNFLRSQTKNPIKAILTGGLVTALLQSSTLVTLLVMSFTSAGIIGLKNGIGIILGANLGTTLTGWLVSLLGFKFHIQTAILPFLAVGGLGAMLFKKAPYNQLFRFLMGFSFMFLGLGYMKDGFTEFAATIDYSLLVDQPKILLLLFGFILAAMIHSSSACMVIYLSVLSAGMIDIYQAFFLVIGSDMGTTMTGLLGSVGGNSIKKKTAWAQFYINLWSAILAVLLMNFIGRFIFEVLNITDQLIALVAFHSIFNALGIISILPFISKFTTLLEKYIGSHKEGSLQFVGEINPIESLSVLYGLEKEVFHFLRKAVDINQAFIVTANRNSKNDHLYDEIKAYENDLSKFVLKIQKNNFNESEIRKLDLLTSAIRYSALSAKDVKDVLHNLEQLKDAVDPNIHSFYLNLSQLQTNFYHLVSDYLNLQNDSKNEVQKLKEVIKTIHQRTSEGMIHLSTSLSEEFNYSSMMNVVHEVNNSNEYLYRALELLSSLNHQPFERLRASSTT
ncbi:MAG: Na/Pi symporter [Saprospiraceae bacterium]|nr:Na/Pi symporter [Saprospiraceae bacterium]MBK7811057.1 Na/Pi symporter [Saprospiraceae bacterium]MBK9630661.1 Na/Pi symporter [Saprospiraceae bacterium]